MPWTVTTVISPGLPVCRRCCARSAESVCCSPTGPKSAAWLFARLRTVKPARRSQRAYEGGVWKAKQLVLPAPHFELPPVESVPSRLASATSAWIEGATAEKYAEPPSGGRFGVEPIITSPTAENVNEPGRGVRGFGFGAGAGCVTVAALAVLDVRPDSPSSSEKTPSASATTSPTRSRNAITRIARSRFGSRAALPVASLAPAAEEREQVVHEHRER